MTLKKQGKGGGEVINLEKQFVKGLQSLGEPSMLKLVGMLQIGRVAFVFNLSSRRILSDLTSQGNPVTRGLSVR